MNSRSEAISTWGVCRAIRRLLSSEVNLISRGNGGSIEPVGDLHGPVGTTARSLPPRDKAKLCQENKALSYGRER